MDGRVVIVSESEAACRAKLIGEGFAPDVAAEIAVYLAQATDLPGIAGEIAAGLDAENMEAVFVELDALPALLPGLADGRTMLWNLTDGIRYYRGSAVPVLARLLGVPSFGSPATAQYFCQDKFASLALAAAAGVPVPNTLLLEGREIVAQLGGGEIAEPDLFVKPNTLGAKIGIFADSRCDGLEAARSRSVRLQGRYRDRAVVQPFLPGADVRVTFLDLGGALRPQLGIARLVADPGSDTGGAFMTMRDNETLSGAADLSGNRGAFGAGRPAAFTPRLVDLWGENRSAAEAVEDAAERLARLLGLRDVFSMDFRLLADGRVVFLEFEVCPAVTIYDFHQYVTSVHRIELGPALASALRRAHRGETGERPRP